MLKKALLSLAATAFIFGGASALQSTPAQATFLHKDRGYTQTYSGGWMQRWHDKWEAKKARKRAWLQRHFGAKHAAPGYVAERPAPRTYRPIK